MPKMNTKPAPIQEQGAGLSVLSTVEWAPTLSARIYPLIDTNGHD